MAATKSAHRGSQSAEPAAKSVRRGSQSASPATKSAQEPHVEKSRFTAPAQKSERLKDHHHVQSADQSWTAHQAWTADHWHLQVNPLRSLAPVTKSPLWTTKARGFPCACHEKCARHHNESAVATSSRSSHPDFANLRIREA